MMVRQLPLDDSLFMNDDVLRSAGEILKDIEELIAAHALGLLGGAVMPEDAHPPLNKNSMELAHYLTLGMALNYQRNSYSLWAAATTTYLDPQTSFVFLPKAVCESSVEDVRAALIRHKLALQPNKHIATWISICGALVDLANGDIRELFSNCGNDISEIKKYVQVTNKKRFPYLSGNKICNYWLYVCSVYLVPPLVNRAALNVAPDTHVLQASRKLGLITTAELHDTHAAEVVALRWATVLEGSGIAPIDVHTPLWLWSRAGFPNAVIATR